MPGSEISVYVSRRRELLSACVFGVFAAIGVEGIVTDTRVGVSILLLVAFGSLLVLTGRRAASRGPVLIIGKEAVVDPKRDLTIRWENVEEARLTEIRGAFSTYHQLHLGGESSSDTTTRRGHDAIDVALLDRLSLSWEQVIGEIERRLPAATVLHRTHQ